MRRTILLQSALGGAFLGLLAAALLVGVGLLLHLLLPASGALRLARAAPLAVPVVGLLCVAAGATLGYLEGRLKL